MALDFTGGIFSFAQQFLTSWTMHSWAPFSMNIAKTLLALETLSFDAILLIQHFVVYNEDYSSLRPPPFQRRKHSTSDSEAANGNDVQRDGSASYIDRRCPMSNVRTSPVVTVRRGASNRTDSDVSTPLLTL
jgi:hypothetical protein